MTLLEKKLGYVLVILMFLCLTLGPILWCFIVSITLESEMFRSTTWLFPVDPTTQNYRMLLDVTFRQSQIFMNALGNSMKATALTLIIGIPVSLMAAYALSRLEFRGRRAIRTVILITIVIPVFTTIIPLYAMFSRLGFLDNIYWLSIVYVSSFMPIVTWAISNYMNTIPRELDEAAFLDGCGRINAFLHIILPNTFPIIFAVVLMIFLMTWSQYQIPLILASSTNTKPLSMIAAEFTAKDMVQYGITAATGMLALIPPAIVAVIFRKSLILGLMRGSVKG